MPSLIKSIARKIIFPVLNKAGISKKITYFSNNNTLILNYHGVLPNPNFSLTPNHLSIKEFENEIKYFATNFNIIHPNQFHSGQINLLDSKKKNIIITFDDGYANNYKYAFPILKKYNAPSIIFPITSLIDTNESTWYDKIDLTISTLDETTINRKLNETLQEITKNKTKFLSRSNLKNTIKYLSFEQKESFFLEYFKYADKSLLKVPTTADFREILTSKNIKEMQESGLVCFGSHTHTHPNLDTLSADSIRNELELSKSILKQITGESITSIAFPDGAYNCLVKDIGHELQYKIMYAVNFRLKEDNIDHKIFQRFSISNTTTAHATIFHTARKFKNLGFNI